MRLALPSMSEQSAPILATFLAALRAPFSPPPAPTRPPANALPRRVQVALQAAARARR